MPDPSSQSLLPYASGDPIPQPEVSEDNSSAAWDEWMQAYQALEMAFSNPAPEPARDDELIENVWCPSRASILHNQVTAPLAHSVAARVPLQRTRPKANSRGSFRLLDFVLQLVRLRSGVRKPVSRNTIRHPRLDKLSGGAPETQSSIPSKLSAF